MLLIMHLFAQKQSMVFQSLAWASFMSFVGPATTNLPSHLPFSPRQTLHSRYPSLDGPTETTLSALKCSVCAPFSHPQKLQTKKQLPNEVSLFHDLLGLSLEIVCKCYILHCIYFSHRYLFCLLEVWTGLSSSFFFFFLVS